MAFLKCTSCSQIYTTKTKLAEHVLSRHSGSILADTSKMAPVGDISRREAAELKYKKLKASSLIMNTPLCPKEKKEDEPKKPLPNRTASDSLANSNRKQNCFFCKRKFSMYIPSLFTHVLAKHLPELKAYALSIATARRDQIKQESSAENAPQLLVDEIDDDLAYILGESRPTDEPAPPKFLCPVCNRPYNSDYFFPKHIEAHIRRFEKAKKRLGDSRIQMSCLNCRKFFPNHKALQCHLRFCNSKTDRIISSNDGQFTCSRCRRSFRYFNIYRKHVKYFHRRLGKVTTGNFLAVKLEKQEEKEETLVDGNNVLLSQFCCQVKNEPVEHVY